MSVEFLEKYFVLVIFFFDIISANIFVRLQFCM